MHPAALLLALTLPLTAMAHTNGFFTAARPAPVDEAGLDAAGIFPRGRRMAYMGYSGNPARDLTNGFTVAGPCYGDDRPYVRTCASNGWPVVAHISHGVRFTDGHPDRYRLDEPTLRAKVADEVRALAPLREIVWWAVSPEELRFWRKDEMRYLEVVCEVIRANDPLGRPVYMYNPNGRTADSLTPVAPHLDVIAKGAYANLAGKKHDRAWVGWSVDQEVEAIRRKGRPGAIALVMPELCQDPEPSEDALIHAWVRHDVYLGLVRGAKGVCLWSLFPRGGVRRIWSRWYDAYAECGRELNGPRGLARVFLFGAPPAATLTLRQTRGPEALRVGLGAKMEPETSTPEEKREREQRLSAWSAHEAILDGAHWLFCVSSANEPASVAVSGWPAGARAEDAFSGNPVALPPDGPLLLDLPPHGVAGLRWIP